MIIAYHYVLHGCSRTLMNFSWLNKVTLECLSMFGKIGVNLFVLITGYFLVCSKARTSKLIKLEIETLFFSLLLLSYMCLSQSYISLTGVLKSIFPILSNSYWFITAYVIMYLFIPYINKMMWSLDIKEIQKLRKIIILIWCIIPTITFQVKNGMNWTQQIWMIATYILGASLKISPIILKKRTINALMSMSIILLLGSVFCFEVVGLRFKIVAEHATYFRWSNTILAVLVSVSIFLRFIVMRDFQSKIINQWASSAIAVYLFHEHHLFSNVLWKMMGCPNLSNYSFALLILHFVFSLIIIYSIGYVLHTFIFEPIYSRFFQYRIMNFIQKRNLEA